MPATCNYCRELIPESRLRYHPECKIKAQAERALQTRRCSRCKKVKPPSSFSSDKSRVTGKFPYCLECQSIVARAGRMQDISGPLNGHFCLWCETPLRGHPNRKKFCSEYCKYRVKRIEEFGLTLEEHRRLEEYNEGKCPICRRGVNGWHIDHDHKTGKVTGLVCAECNVQLLTASKHSVIIAEGLLNYLVTPPVAVLGIAAEVTEAAQKRMPVIDRTWNFRAARARGQQA